MTSSLLTLIIRSYNYICMTWKWHFLSNSYHYATSSAVISVYRETPVTTNYNFPVYILVSRKLQGNAPVPGNTRKTSAVSQPSILWVENEGCLINGKAGYFYSCYITDQLIIFRRLANWTFTTHTKQTKNTAIMTNRNFNFNFWTFKIVWKPILLLYPVNLCCLILVCLMHYAIIL